VGRFILYHQRQHPKSMGAPVVAAFLSDLAVRGAVSACSGAPACG